GKITHYPAAQARVNRAPQPVCSHPRFVSNRMPRPLALHTEQQFSLAYLLAEIALIAITLAAVRLALFPSLAWIEAQTVLLCIALTAACGALGGLCFRMTLGLIGGGIFSVSSIPLLWLILLAGK